MAAQARQANILPFAVRPDPAADDGIDDLRFRALVGEAAWARLPATVRKRFSKRVAHCRTILYSGEILECRMSRAGWWLAQLGRLIGAPLPLSCDATVPAAASITEDTACGGQFWVRIYGRRCGFPQVIRSSKRFCGPTGLEEHIGRGFGIALRTEVKDGALHFVSDHYFLSVLGLRLCFPRWLAPGSLRVSHVDCNHGRFAFVLALGHPLLGELMRQTVMFEDPPAGESA